MVEQINDLRICEHYGWALEYVQDMDIEAKAMVLGVMEGDAFLNKYRANKKKKASSF